jgi:dipeptidyl aminopeptidase/acylaminoacyl peptidase
MRKITTRVVPRPIAGAGTSLLLILGALAIVPPASAQSQTAPDTFQPWHAVMYRSVISTEVSPDGRQIAFVRTNPRRPLADENGPAWTELYLLGADGSEVPFITGQVSIGGVTWLNPQELVFLARRGNDARRAVYRISTAGGEARKVFEHTAEISAFDVSPDGRWVAFLTTERKSEEVRNLESKGFNQEIFEEELLFTRLGLADLRSGDGPADREVKMLDVEGSVRRVAFAPDSQRLLIAVTPTPLVDDSYVAQTLRVLDLEGDVSATLETAGKLGPAAWSPDGRHVAVVAGVDRNDPAAGRLIVVPAEGGVLRDLLPGLEGHVAAFDWQDARTLVYSAYVGAETEIGSVSIEGGASRTILPRGTLIVSDVDVDGSGRAALVAQTPRHPDELYTLALGDGNVERRTTSNDWLPDLRLADQEVIRFKARDGLEVEGILMRPLDYRDGQRYPLVLVVHGGPESHYTNGWLTGYSTPGQVAAARGFAVFYPNYRGSTGRGVEFSKISQAAATGPEFDDLIDGVDHLIDIGLVDRDKVAITGGSYGGYASAWGATYYSDRFAAAIPFVGISNAISKVGTTDIPQEMYDVHHRKWLWEDWEYFAEASPIFYATRNRTPTLILHGKDDPRVHPSQSLELYRHLKVLGQAPVRLVFYPGEGHGNSRAAARLDYALRTLRWIEHYLKGPGGEPPDTKIEYHKHLPWADEEADGKKEEPEAAEVASGANVARSSR